MRKDASEDNSEDLNIFSKFFLRARGKLTKPSTRAEKWLLDYPLSCGLLLESLVCLIFASHAMLMRYGRNELVEDVENHDEIFMVFKLPGDLANMTEWFTIKGQESLIVPIVFIVLGMGLFGVQNLLDLQKSTATKSATLVIMILFASIVFLVTS